ncbi:hypothetical protein FQA39_LY17186 [Lamprigera yunnana]|nr:hypothetical protein FQA39_LY17186 [Lamprigera yunnana]
MLLNQTIYYLNKSKSKWISVGLYYPFEFASVVKIFGRSKLFVIFKEEEWIQFHEQRENINKYFQTLGTMWKPRQIGSKTLTFEKIEEKKILKIEDMSGNEVYLGWESVSEVWSLESVLRYRLSYSSETQFIKKMWMLYAERHWTKAIDCKSVVERLYEKLGALEFDADYEAIYGMEIYYTVQQCEKFRDKYKIGRKVCRKFLKGKTCSQCLVKRISEIGLRHFLDTINKYIKDCSDSDTSSLLSSSDKEVFKAVEQNDKDSKTTEEESEKAKVEALLHLFHNLSKDSLNHSLKLNTIFKSNFFCELSERFSKRIEICNKYLNGNICLKCLQIQLFSNNLEEYF